MKENILKIAITILFLIPFLSGCIYDGSDIYLGNIQEYIDEASDGDTIYISSGIYYETVVINKSINLIGEGEDKTVIDCKNNKNDHINIILINADNCTIKGFKIINTNVSSDVIGININSSNNTISNNAISRTNKGVYFHSYTKDNNIYDNNITNNQKGITLTFSHNNNISKNNISFNSECGIGMHSLLQDNIISLNVIFDNKYGIHLADGSQNKIFKNIFINNQRGVYLCCGARNNTLYNNLFKQNSDCNARDVTNNQWNTSSIGNYWDDYTGVDKNGDGMGDVPYNISGGNSQDMHPIMNPYGPFK